MTPVRYVRGLLVVALWALAVCVAPRAHASVSFTVVFDALVAESNAAVVGTPIDSKSQWEDGRIATYTKVRIDRAVAGSTSANEVWIRTLGGVVGNIGQQVEGEAVLRAGQTSLLFLTWSAGTFVVTARGQGQFPVVPDASNVPRLKRNMHAGALLGPNPRSVARVRSLTASPNAVMPAADVLDGKSIDDAVTEIAGAWTRTHAP